MRSREPGLFSQRVIKLALTIPKGRVTTYGRLARAAGGGAMASQSVTSILWRAQERGIKGIPWHRIVYSDGRVWMDENCRKERTALYKKEKIKLDEKDKIVDFQKILV